MITISEHGSETVVSPLRRCRRRHGTFPRLIRLLHVRESGLLRVLAACGRGGGIAGHLVKVYFSLDHFAGGL